MLSCTAVNPPASGKNEGGRKAAHSLKAPNRDSRGEVGTICPVNAGPGSVFRATAPFLPPARPCERRQTTSPLGTLAAGAHCRQGPMVSGR